MVQEDSNLFRFRSASTPPVAAGAVALCSLLLSGLIPTVLADSGAVHATTTQTAREALDYAFRFATAIVSDEKDRTRAQEEVVSDYTTAGAFAEARDRALRIEGWRRGTALADLAGALAREGRAVEARELLRAAEEIRKKTGGWQGPRVAAHIAAALALLGEEEQATAMVTGLAAEDRQYSGPAAATAAIGKARRGDLDGALQRLAGLDGDPDMDVAWARTEGYLEIARLAGKDPAIRDRALEAARRSADGLPGWKKADGIGRVADVLARQGKVEEARAALGEAEAIARSLPPTMPVKVAILADLARIRGATRDTEDARGLLRDAEDCIAATLVIERPALLARVGAAYSGLGDRNEARRLYDRALAEVGNLVNARPRALALVTICRSLGQDGGPLRDPVRARLDHLLAGLKDPW